MSLWNIKNLPVPPINTYRAEQTNVDINYLNEVFREGKKFFDNEKYMSAEYALMSRIVYRSKQKFRSAKDFKALVKLHKALDNFFNTTIVSDLKRFIELIPYRYTDDTYLPNKNMLDFILVRLQGLAKLLERIVETCKIAAYLFERRMHTGHFWKVGFIIFSLVSRIYILAKYTAKFICGFYAKLVPFSHQLRNNGRNWLPENYVLPTDLQKWLNVDWLDVDDEIQVIETPEMSNVAQLFDLVEDDDDDIQFCEEYIMVNDEEDIELVREFRNLDEININRLRGVHDEDVGEVIEVNDDSLLQLEEAPDSSQAFIGVNDTLQTPQNTFIENGEDIGEVIDLNDNIQLTGDPSSENKTSTNDTNDITKLDNSLQPELDEANRFLSLEVQNEAPKTPTDFVIVNDETILVPESPALNESNQEKHRIKSENKNLRCDKTEINVPKFLENGPSTQLFEQNGNTSSESDTENVITISDSSILDETVNDKVKKKLKAKKKLFPNAQMLKNMSQNYRSSASDTENVITISDSSILDESVNGKVLKKKLKSKRKVFPNSQMLKNRINTDVSQNHRSGAVMNLNSKKKKNKPKKPKNIVPKNVQVANAHPNRKRKLDNSAESSSKKLKKNPTLIKQEPSFVRNKPLNIKQEYPLRSDSNSIKQERSFIRNSPLNIKQEFPIHLSNTPDVKPVIVKTENRNSATCSNVGNTAKQKSKKTGKKKAKSFDNKVPIAQKTNGFKHITNKVHHYKSQNRNKNNIPGKKKKNRNNKNKKQMYF